MGQGAHQGQHGLLRAGGGAQAADGGVERDAQPCPGGRDDGAGLEGGSLRRAGQGVARQDGAAGAILHQVQDGGHAVDLQRHLGAATRPRHFGFDVHADGVGPGGDDQRQAGDFGQRHLRVWGGVPRFFGAAHQQQRVAGQRGDFEARHGLRVVEHGDVEAAAGAVYVPALDELFTAHEGGGSALNGHPIRVSDAEELALSLVATGFGYTVERRTEQAEVVRQLIPRVRDIRRMGAAAVDLCNLAAGRLDAYYERGLAPWDFAAGALIAREAGAAILSLAEGELPGEPMLIAGPPSLARDLRAEIQRAYASLPEAGR